MARGELAIQNSPGPVVANIKFGISTLWVTKVRVAATDSVRFAPSNLQFNMNIKETKSLISLPTFSYWPSAGHGQLAGQKSESFYVD